MYKRVVGLDGFFEEVITSIESSHFPWLPRNLDLGGRLNIVQDRWSGKSLLVWERHTYLAGVLWVVFDRDHPGFNGSAKSFAASKKLRSVYMFSDSWLRWNWVAKITYRLTSRRIKRWNACATGATSFSQSALRVELQWYFAFQIKVLKLAFTKPTGQIVLI